MQKNRFSQIIVIATLCFVLPWSDAQGAPLTVTDDSENVIALQEPARRIVSLAPHLTELLFAIHAGERIVGTVDYSDYPHAAKSIARIGSAYGLDLERIVALQPDLILAWASGNPAHSVAHLERLGFTVYRNEPRQLENIATSLTRLGILTDRQRAGRLAAEEFMRRKQSLVNQYAGLPKVRVFYQIWGQPLMTINKRHLINEVIDLCGGENVFAQLPALVPVVSVEPVLAMNPEVIISWSLDDNLPPWLSQWKRWNMLHAGIADNLFVVHPDFISRHTPRILNGAQRICDVLQSARDKRTKSVSTVSALRKMP